MIEQMNTRIGHDGTYPIWLWEVEPNLVEEGFDKKGTQLVCLAVELPKRKVLLSDFDAWHCVLNDIYLPLNQSEDDKLEKGLFQISKEKSWERIFDLDLLSSSEYWNGNSRWVQGVTGKIPLKNIVDYNYFIAH